MKILMPQLGETVNEGTISAWHKKVGDEVEKDDLLLDVETDKVATEIPAPISGILTAIKVEEGDFAVPAASGGVANDGARDGTL